MRTKRLIEVSSGMRLVTLEKRGTRTGREVCGLVVTELRPDQRCNHTVKMMFTLAELDRAINRLVVLRNQIHGERHYDRLKARSSKL